MSNCLKSEFPHWRTAPSSLGSRLVVSLILNSVFGVLFCLSANAHPPEVVISEPVPASTLATPVSDRPELAIAAPKLSAAEPSTAEPSTAEPSTAEPNDTNLPIQVNLASPRSELLPKASEPEALELNQVVQFFPLRPAIVAQDSSGTVGDTFSPEQLRQELLIEPVTTRPRLVGAPASTLSTPTAFGANFGSAFIGLSLVDRPRGGDSPDGSAVLGFGVGDARRYAGLEVAVGVISLSDSNGRDSIGGSGNVNFKLHRILPGNVGIAVGWENAIAWGDARQADSSVYGVVSRAFPLQPSNRRHPLPLVLSVGVGGGRFRSAGDIKADKDSVGAFASAGLRVTPQTSLIANWTGQDLNLGASVAPFRGVPLTITLGLADVTGSAGDGVRFALGIGYGVRFRL